jgi:DNA mismatch repair enzyme (predicted ATPase)
MIAKDCFPGYFLNIEVDPADIDINIHPTKTEVNFQDVKLVYAILHAAVRKAIGQHNLSPMIDFEESADINIDFGEVAKASRPIVRPFVPVDATFNPFQKRHEPFEGLHQWSPRTSKQDDWRKLYGERTDVESQTEPEAFENQKLCQKTQYLQVQQSYILTSIKSGIILIDQRLAHCRILFEKFLKEMENHSGVSQQELFPQHVSLNLSDAMLLKDILPELENLGFVIESVNATTFMVKGTPSNSQENDAATLVEKIIENYKLDRSDLQIDKKLALAKTMAWQLAIKQPSPLSEIEMQNIVDQLFACNVAEIAPNGKKTYVILNMEELKTRFN